MVYPALGAANAGSAFCRIRRSFVDLGSVLLSSDSPRLTPTYFLDELKGNNIGKFGVGRVIQPENIFINLYIPS